MIIPAAYTLDRVHRVIQEAMGWRESHLHMFRIADREYGMLTLGGEPGLLDERKFRLGDLAKPGDRIEYEYDFGDGWEHERVGRRRLRPRTLRPSQSQRDHRRDLTACCRG